MADLTPDDPEYCPNAPADDPGHCEHWYDCEPCHRCGDDTIDPKCDCPRCTEARQPTPIPQWTANGFINALDALVLSVEENANLADVITCLAYYDLARKRMDRMQANNKFYRSQEDGGRE